MLRNIQKHEKIFSHPEDSEPRGTAHRAKLTAVCARDANTGCCDAVVRVNSGWTLVLRQISFSRRAGVVVRRILMKLDDGRVKLFQGKLIQNSLTNALKNGKNLFAGALVMLGIIFRLMRGWVLESDSSG